MKDTHRMYIKKENTQVIPAYIKFKYKTHCKACNEVIEANELGFWHKDTKGSWHGKCGNSDWKKPGTPFYTRKAMAIDHAINKKIALTAKDKIKLALRRFRKELEIKPADLNMEAEVFSYLSRNKLIDVCYGGYCIVPRGFNWNVDKNCVEMPDSDEDIMERDAEIEQDD